MWSPFMQMGLRPPRPLSFRVAQTTEIMVVPGPLLYRVCCILHEPMQAQLLCDNGEDSLLTGAGKIHLITSKRSVSLKGNQSP